MYVCLLLMTVQSDQPIVMKLWKLIVSLSIKVTIILFFKRSKKGFSQNKTNFSQKQKKSIKAVSHLSI